MKNKRITPAKANMMAMAKNGGLKGFMKGGGAYDGLIKAQDGFAQGAQYDKIHGLLEAAMKTDGQMNALKANPFIAETFKNKIEKITPALQAKYDKQSSDYLNAGNKLYEEGVTSYQKGGGTNSKSRNTVRLENKANRLAAKGERLSAKALTKTEKASKVGNVARNLKKKGDAAGGIKKVVNRMIASPISDRASTIRANANQKMSRGERISDRAGKVETKIARKAARRASRK
tara:strand:+ start:1707 stop:2402 length:696 start_codon:yes stop_codon:yes gene_type:complete